MSKELLISIKPEHLVNILNGKKTLELRKTVPKDYKGWVNIYCTKSPKNILYKYKDIYYTQHYLTFTDYVDILNRKVVARFWFDEYEKYENTDLYSYTYRHRIDKLFNQACITADELYKYIKKVKPEEETTYRKYYPFYAWHIKQLEIFDKPKALSEFYKTNLPYVGINVIKHALETNNTNNLRHYSLTKAPQSYQFVYVKELKNEV